jgi:hypothetical protein
MEQWDQIGAYAQQAFATTPNCFTSTTYTLMQQQTNATWITWNSVYASNTATTGQQWIAWNQEAWQQLQVRLDEQERQRLRDIEVLRAQYQAAEAERAAADLRAKEALKRELDPVQREELEKTRSFILRTEKRIYRIRIQNTVEELDKDSRVIARFCIHPDRVPAHDAALAQKLMLEADEASFHRIANRHAA